MQNTLVELEQQIASIQSVVKQLQSLESISIMDKDLLQQKCLVLYEHILSLVTQEGHHPLFNSPIATVDSTQELKLNELPTPESDILLVNDIPEVEEEPLPSKDLDLFAELPKTETEATNEFIQAMIEEEQLLRDTEDNPKPTTKTEIQELSLHEKIAHALPTKPDLSEKLSSGGIASLKSAINVNLKIAIVNDLFKENTVEYVKAIDKLNNSDSIHEAMRYFTELKHTYDWDNQNTLVKELENLINKRFQ